MITVRSNGHVACGLWDVTTSTTRSNVSQELVQQKIGPTRTYKHISAINKTKYFVLQQYD